VLEEEVVDALTFAGLIYFDPSDGFFAQTTHFEYTPRLACAPSLNGMFIFFPVQPRAGNQAAYEAAPLG
jgi:hypothetical protein